MANATPQSPEDYIDIINALPWIPQQGPQTQLFASDADEILYGGAAGGGKCLKHGACSLIWRNSGDKVPSLTTEGRQMILKTEDIKVGDYFPGSDGKPTRIIAKSLPERHPFYRVDFNDGSSLEVSGNHRWTVFDNGRKISKPPYRHGKELVLTTDEIREIGLTYRKANRFSIPLVSGPIDMPNPVKPPVPAYALGYWLGNGSAQMGSLTCHSDDGDEIAALIGASWGSPPEVRKYEEGTNRHRLLTPGWRQAFITAEFPISRLTDKAGAFDKIAICETLSWRHWAPADRKELLNGLLDSDGHANTRGDYEFDNTCLPMVELARGLLQSLGQRPAKIAAREGRPNEQTMFRVFGVASIPLFKLRRKADRLRPRTKQSLARRFITGITPIGSKIGQCFTVDNPDHLFVAGDDFIVTHNSDAAIGYALTKSRRALILRRHFPQLMAINDRFSEIIGRDNYRATDQTWTYEDPFGVTHKVELGSCPNLGDEAKFQGRPHDALILDEAAHFDIKQVDFLTGWLRDTNNRRCRLICASNPPLDGTGVWMIERWKPWLDPNYPRPAQSGEIRYFLRDHADGWMEVPKDTPLAISRTFIKATLKDNKYLDGGEYEARLNTLPEHLRMALLNGDFLAGGQDRALAAIPASWIKAAQARWTPEDANLIPITHIGVDPSRGGDRTVITLRHRHHVAEQIIVPKDQCKTGGQVAARVIALLGDGDAKVRVDAIGIGASVLDHLAAYLPPWQLEGIVASASAPVTAADDRVGYANQRAYAIWQLRLRLNPLTATLALPPDPALYAELSAPEYSLTARGILIEGKDQIIKRLGASPDKADSCVLACVP